MRPSRAASRQLRSSERAMNVIVRVQRLRTQLRDGLEQLLGTLRVLVDLAHHVAGRVRRATAGEVERDDLADFLVERRRTAEDARRAARTCLRDAAEDRFAKPALVAEVVVEERFVDAGFLGDLLHPRAGGAAPHEHDVRGVEDALLGVAIPIPGRRGARRFAGCCAVGFD